MKFGQLKLENFGPYRSASINLADRGLLLIEGENNTTDTTSSNGAGKSFILEGVAYALYGQTVRGMSPDGVVNKAIGKNCVVTLDIDLDGRQVRIERTRKHQKAKNSVTLTVDGKDATGSGIRDTDSRIVDIIGCDFDTFRQAVYFDGKNIPSLPCLTDKEIKLLIERMLGIDLFDRVLDVIREQKNSVKFDMVKVETEHTAKIARRDEIAAAYDKARTEYFTKADSFGINAGIRETKRNELLAHLIVVEEEIDNGISLEMRNMKVARGLQIEAILSGCVEESGTSSETNLRTLRSVQEINLNAAAVINAELDKLRGESIEALPIIVALKTRILDAEKKIASLNSTAKTCELCGSKLGDSHHRELLDKAEQESLDLKSQLADARDREKAALSNKIAKKEQDADTIQKNIAINAKNIEEEEAALADKADKKERLRDLELERAQLVNEVSRYDSLQSQKRRLEVELEALNEKEDSDRSDLALSNAEFLRLSELTEKVVDSLKEIEKEYEGLKSKYARLVILENAYGMKGIRVELLEKAAPFLNERTAYYLRMLTDNAIEVRFETITEGKEKFSVTVQNLDGGDDYMSSSAGERRKIDLSIALALSDLVGCKAKKAINFWCGDELFESLDSVSAKLAVKVLEDIASRRGTAIVISHVPMEEHISNVITVRKGPTGSTFMDTRTAYAVMGDW